MTTGSGIAIASVWVAVSFGAYTFRNDMSPFGLVICFAIATAATAYITGIRITP